MLDCCSTAAASAVRGVAATMLASLLAVLPADAGMVIRFPASENPEVFAAQKTLVEAWTIVGSTFVDHDFNGVAWEDELPRYMAAVYRADTGPDAYAHVQHMLDDLGDPYTKLMPPQQYQSFRVATDGELQGVGMMLATDSDNHRLFVLAPIHGGPADRAGVLPGDELLSVNGEKVDGMDGEGVAKLLRGKGGTAVTVKFARRSLQIPGVAGMPEEPPKVQYREVRLKRERVQLASVQHALLQRASDDDDGDAARVGYIRVLQFSNNAPTEVAAAIAQLEDQGADNYILDLRRNPGGLVSAGIEVARLWLDGDATVLHVSPRIGEPSQSVALRASRALTHDPLVVLVDHESASASEILAGALHDNKRATIMGERTYGKGKIQSVYELKDGSALFVTVAKYQTPSHVDIDQVGIVPDHSCAVRDAPPLRGSFGPASASLLQLQLKLDSCVASAEQALLASSKVALN